MGGGTAAPGMTFRDLHGSTISLSDYRGSQTLLLFWNPACGYCDQMLGALKNWEAAPPAGAPKLLVISTGTVEENRAMNLRSPVVIDHDLRAMSTFGANGTPMAVLLDGAGRVTSDIASGADAVLALAAGR